MAAKTYLLGEADDGRVQWQATYDDVSLLLTGLSCVNHSNQGPTPGPASSRLWLINDTTRDFPNGSFSDPTKARITAAGATDSVSIPTTQAQRMQLNVVDHHGNPAVANLGGEFTWPAA